MVIKISECISLPRSLRKWDYGLEEGVKNFLRNPSGYLTIDCADLEKIEKGGLEPIVKAASELQGSDKGHLELVNVSEDIYIHLMNIKSPKAHGKRLISLAEIYTNRIHKEIMLFADALILKKTHFGVDEQTLVDTFNRARENYNKLHGSSGTEEIKKEYGLIQCIRLIEEKKQDADKIAHLGYVYGQVKEINIWGDISDKVSKTRDKDESETKPTLREGRRYKGKCKFWNDKKNYGFVTVYEVNEDLFVHGTEIVSKDKFIVEGWNYEVTAKYNKSRGEWRGVNVTFIDV